MYSTPRTNTSTERRRNEVPLGISYKRWPPGEETKINQSGFGFGFGAFETGQQERADDNDETAFRNGE